MNKARLREQRWFRGLCGLACLVVIVTALALSRPAITQEGTAFCGIDEHSHTDACYARELSCGLAEGGAHTHTDGCYTETLLCGLTEHTHSLACYSDPEADVETAEVWEASLAAAELTGEYWQDVLAVAGTQLGYTESTKNYVVLEDGATIRGYTRYGDWYGDPYGDWCAMFVSFCLFYAGVPKEVFPRSGSCAAWVEELAAAGLYASAAGYVDGGGPWEGDLVFFDRDGDGAADHVGLVSGRVFAADGQAMTGFTTVEGNSNNAVEAREYALTGAAVLGFGLMPADGTEAAAEPAAQAATNVTVAADGSITYTERVLQPVPCGNINESTAYGIAFSDNGTYKYMSIDAADSSKTGNQNSLAGIPNEQLIWRFRTAADGRYTIYTWKYLKLDSWNLTLGSDDSGTFELLGRTDTTYTDFRSYINGQESNNYINPFGGTGNFQGFAGYSDGGTPGLTIRDAGGNTVAFDAVDETGATAYAIVFDDNGTSKYMSTVSATAGGQAALASSNEAKYIWRFLSDGNGRYWIYTEEYLKLDSSGNLTLSSDTTGTFELSDRTSSDIANDTDFKGFVNGTSSGKYINAFGGAGNFQGFSGWSSGSNGLYLLAYADVEKTIHTVATMSPTGTTINLFDYWVSEDPDETTARNADYGYSGDFHDTGINAGHPLKFHMGYLYHDDDGIYNTDYSGTVDEYNNFTGGATQGLVQNKLVDGYPKLNGKLWGETDPGVTPDNKSLRYLFDPSIPDSEVGYRKSFTNVQGLLSLDAEGFYSYNSKDSFAYFNETDNETPGAKANSFTVYDTPWVTGTTGTEGQFFPFSELSELVRQGVTSQEDYDNLNHYFGVTVTSRFIQQNKGKVSAQEKAADLEFEFEGDDDVWIFIDNVLVADIGGIHGAVKTTINFATGNVTVSSVSRPADAPTETTLKAAFAAALGAEDAAKVTTWSGDTFADGTTHTLKFFYLERGGGSSNMQLKYNLIEVPETAIYKVDQYGDPVSGAAFALYPAVAVKNEDGTVKSYAYAYKGDDGKYVSYGDITITDISATGVIRFTKAVTTTGENEETTTTTETGTITPAFTGTTDPQGRMLLRDPATEGLYTMSDLQDMFGEYAILRETDIPDGYRTVSDEAWLHLDDGGNVIICENSYSSGIWASNNALVTATGQLYKVTVENNVVSVDEKKPVDYITTDTGTGVTSTTGTLFAVVLKRSGASLSSIDSWHPVYGSDTAGYTVADGSGVAAAIEAAKRQAVFDGSETEPDYSGIVFSPQASGNVQVLLENLPGKIDRYYTYLWNEFQPVTTEGSPSKYQQFLAEYDNTETQVGLEPQYFVAYYYTTAETGLAGADATNTSRVVSRQDIVENYSGFSIQWGTTIEVPNFENRLFVQQTEQNSEGEEDLVAGAMFALYEVYDAAPNLIESNFSRIYYVGEDVTPGRTETDEIYVALRDNSGSANKNTGPAYVFGNHTDADGKQTAYVIGSGTYSIDTNFDFDDTSMLPTGENRDNAGKITVTLDTLVTPDTQGTGEMCYQAKFPDGPINYAPGDTFAVYPARSGADTGQTGDILVTYTHDNCPYVSNEEKTGHFSRLKPGKYYLRQIGSAEGYAINTTNIPVLVNENGVYAYAGAAENPDNGVAVGNGIGYLTRTLDVFASLGQIDETLSWVYAALLQNNAPDFSGFDAVSGDVIHVGEGVEVEGDDKGQYLWQFVTANPDARAGYGAGTTMERGKAMVTYLTYDGALAAEKVGSPIFDYSPTADQEAAGTAAGGKSYQRTVNVTVTGADGTKTITPVSLQDGEGTRRLYTDVGWSDLAIYQDYAYGISQTSTNATTNYDDLTGYGNISNLFSSSTFVRVTDYRDVVVKAVDDAARTVTLAGAGFRLSRSVTDTNGTVTQYYDPEKGAWGTDEAKALTVTNSDGLTALFLSLRHGTYSLTCVKPPDGYNALKEIITVTVSSAGVAAEYDGVSIADGGAPNSETNGTVFTLTVPFSAGYELPETGGPGTGVYAAAGLVLCVAAALLFLRRRRWGQPP